MVQRVVTEVIDDVDGSAAQETIRFGIDDTQYEIDLSRVNAERLRELLRPWADSARRVGKNGRAGARVDLGPAPQVVRAWGRANGYQMRSRGRVPVEVCEAFAEAHRGTSDGSHGWAAS